MALALDELPRDPDRLLHIVQQMAEVVARQNASLVSLRAEHDTVLAERDGAQAEVEKLRLLIRQLQRGRFGRRSEKLDPDQLQLGLEDLEQAAAAAEAVQEEAAARSSTPPSGTPGSATQPGRSADAPAAGRGAGRPRGQELPLLRRRPAPGGGGRGRAPRSRTLMPSQRMMGGAEVEVPEVAAS